MHNAWLCLYTGAVARSGAPFGQGKEPTLLDGVRCSGSEGRLFDCPHNGFEIENCDHSKDAGVACQTGIQRGIFFV